MTLPRSDYSSKIFVALREAAGTHWDDYIDHAFVRGLGDGSLPKSSFLYYLMQDYVYLRHYARAWAMGVIKASTLAETRLCAATVHGMINVETPLHVAVCAREGISEEQLFQTEEAIENLSYTRFVLDVGNSGDFLDLLVALAPCAFGYGEIGLRIAKTAAADTPYQEWIDTYSGEAFQEICHNIGRLLDQAFADRIGGEPHDSPRWQQLCHIFTMATKLETSFWQMGLRGGQP